MALRQDRSDRSPDPAPPGAGPSEIATLRRAMAMLEARVLDLEAARKTMGETTHRLGADVLSAAAALNDRLESLALRFEAHVAERPVAAARAPTRSDRPLLAVIIALELLIVGVAALWAPRPREPAAGARTTLAKVAAPPSPAAAAPLAPAPAPVTPAPPPTLVAPGPNPTALPAKDTAADAAASVKVFYGISQPAPPPAEAKPAGQ